MQMLYALGRGFHSAITLQILHTVSNADWHTGSSELPSSLSIRGSVPRPWYRCVVSDQINLSLSGVRQGPAGHVKIKNSDCGTSSSRKEYIRETSSTIAKAGVNEVITRASCG